MGKPGYNVARQNSEKKEKSNDAFYSSQSAKIYSEVP
jgi:hypothetical protein